MLPPLTGTLYNSVMRDDGNNADSTGSCIDAENNTYLPSGENASGISEAELDVSLRAWPPAVSTAYISKFPLRSLAKAIDFPSGLHTGFDS